MIPQEPDSRAYLQAVAKMLTDYLRKLASFDALAVPQLLGEVHSELLLFMQTC